MRTYTCGDKGTRRGCGFQFEVDTVRGPLPRLCGECRSITPPERRTRSEATLLHVLSLQVVELRLAVEQVRGAIGMGNLRLAQAVLDNFEAPRRAA